MSSLPADHKTQGKILKDDYVTPLDRIHEFCRRGDVVAFRENFKNNQHMLNDHGRLGNTMMHWAAQAGADINAINDVGDTALHLAAWKDHVDSISLLVKSGANRSIKNKNGKTPINLCRSEKARNALPEITAQELGDVFELVDEDDEDE